MKPSFGEPFKNSTFGLQKKSTSTLNNGNKFRKIDPHLEHIAKEIVFENGQQRMVNLQNQGEIRLEQKGQFGNQRDLYRGQYAKRLPMPNEGEQARDIDFSGWRKQNPKKKSNTQLGTNRQGNMKKQGENEDLFVESKPIVSLAPQNVDKKMIDQYMKKQQKRDQKQQQQKAYLEPMMEEAEFNQRALNDHLQFNQQYDHPNLPQKPQNRPPQVNQTSERFNFFSKLRQATNNIIQ